MDQEEKKLWRAFLCGFCVSRDGFNGECAFDHLAPDKLFENNHFFSIDDMVDFAESCPELAVLFEQFMKDVETNETE